ncbi:receptor protein-tyrosine kinase [Caenorhabditis elegans]|uniref:receptor protein-tyrosine kinase n=1 Tax=Caenorhabditis elegans TaxID=6239 RepID=A0A0K3AVM0_CAEEL|nr:receptor protein-tyrosine kinase [Caenorhabditis elegans]CTQ87067.1 receptor protein-tyrosine kinase [Caenorhabditis elegans]|eukprot:NP_001300356.1 Myoblast growth factor receptor egl-15 [Caenorhabditis elegans]
MSYFLASCLGVGLLSTVSCSLQGLTSHYRENIPRFKHVANERYEVFLGDEIKFDCQTAASKISAFVEWYRNDKLLKNDQIDKDKIRKDNNRMMLHLKNIDVSDQGLWSCRVHNAYGQISRNFTVEVIDFCDYFLFPDIHHLNIPMECVCLWKYNKEAKRSDVNYAAVTGEVCSKYASRMINRARKPLPMIPCFGDHCKEFDTTPVSDFGLPGKPEDDPLVKRVVLKKDDVIVPVHDSEESPSESRTEFINADEKENKEDEEEDYSVSQPVAPDAGLTELNITAEEPPYFKSNDNIVLFNETHALPAGRTLKLNCRAKGYPEPQIIWYKNGKMLKKSSARSGGYEFKFNRWSLEVEDAVVADSGEFHCEALNKVGSAKKYFHVIIVNRMRRPPIIVPNILANQSVNINDTATFHCKVVSDLLPHIIWVRINKINGSYSYYNNSAEEYMFNYTEMDTFDKAHVHHVGDESTLTIFNVSLDDQGIYACLSGNSLGMSMANATLTVNEFMAIHLLTGDEPKIDRWTTSDYIFTTILLFLLLAATLFGILFMVCKQTLHKKGFMDDTVGLVARKKRVVVSKRPMNEDNENSDDEPSPYQIQIIETPITKKEAARKQRKRMNSENTVLSEYEVDSDPVWEVERSKLSLVHMLGEGAFGEVWKATYKETENNEIAVAVKKLKMSAHEKELIDLVSEMETFKVIGEHENVLRLIGCCTGAGPLYVVVELCKHGNLRDFLRAHRPKEEKAKKSSQELTDYLEPRKASDKDDIELIPNLTQRHLVQFAWQVAQGMNFLASKKIIHRDLAARNVLVGDGHVLKISDFGLSRDVHCNDYYRKRGNGRLPIKWMALEALDSNVYTVESDVWSYGVLLWEIMTLGGTPYPTIAMPELYANLKEGYRMEPPHLCPQEVYHLMCSCWREKLEERPSFKTIVDYLDWMLTMTNETIEGSQEFNDQFFSERSTASGPVSPMESFQKKRKHRPLSAPVNLPSEPQHTICDDYESNFSVEPPNDPNHLYCNDNMLKNHIITPETSQLYIHKVLNEPIGNGYVRQDKLARAVSGVANQSLDSALGSPAWPSYDRPSNKASCLDQTHQYYNTTSKIQYLHFTFDDPDCMTRSRDSAIFEESYHPNYIQSHPLYSKIIIKKNMTPRNPLPTKETIV